MSRIGNQPGSFVKYEVPAKLGQAPGCQGGIGQGARQRPGDFNMTMAIPEGGDQSARCQRPGDLSRTMAIPEGGEQFPPIGRDPGTSRTMAIPEGGEQFPPIRPQPQPQPRQDPVAQMLESVIGMLQSFLSMLGGR